LQPILIGLDRSSRLGCAAILLSDLAAIRQHDGLIRAFPGKVDTGFPQGNATKQRLQSAFLGSTSSNPAQPFRNAL